MEIGRKYKLIKLLAPRLYLSIQAKKPYYQDMLFPVLNKLCDPDANSIDIGTNHGIYSYWMSKYSNRVYSFEPNPILIKELKRTLPSNCLLIEKGLSNVKTKLKLCVPEDDGLSSFEKDNVNIKKLKIDKKINEFEVEVCLLDDLKLSNIKFIKIDVEGHEIEVLQGAINTIKENRPRVFVEIKNENRENADNLILNYFKKLNYQSFFIEGRRLRKFNKENLSDNYFVKGGNVLMIHESDEFIKREFYEV